MRSTYQQDTAHAGHPHRAPFTLPSPITFGLPANFDLNGFLAERKRRRDRIKTLSERSILLLCCLIGAPIAIANLEPSEDVFSIIGMLILVFVPSLAISALITLGIMDSLDCRPISAEQARIIAYEAATTAAKKQIEDWNERQRETGLTYWREKRGVLFEQAVKALLSRRGCSVQTTKGSGDGGIDLVVMVGTATYWCQCKGHAAPIGVSAIRKIAGVCSQGGGTPAVVAVNGYTKAAIEAANNLDVMLLDAPDLVRMGKLERLMSLAPVASARGA